MRRAALAVVLLAACGGPPPAPSAPASAGTSATRAEPRIVLRANAKGSAGADGEVTRPFSGDATWRVVPGPRALGMSGDEAWKVALENTKKALPTEAFTVTNNAFIVFQGDDAPATLLFPDLLLDTARKHLPGHDGHLLAVAPEENVVLYTIGGPAEVTLLRAAAKEGKTSTRPLSEVVMEWDGQAWHEAK
jgi:hypothetical protein